MIAAVRDDVENRGHLRQHHRVVQWQQYDAAHELNFAGHAGRRGKTDQRIRDRPVEHHVLAAAQIVVAQVFGIAGELRDFPGRR